MEQHGIAIPPKMTNAARSTSPGRSCRQSDVVPRASIPRRQICRCLSGRDAQPLQRGIRGIAASWGQAEPRAKGAVISGKTVRTRALILQFLQDGPARTNQTMKYSRRLRRRRLTVLTRLAQLISTMFEQITLHRTEVLKLLRHLHEIKTALSRSFDGYYQGEFDDIEDQLLTMKSEVDQLLLYFESQHQIGIAAASKGAA